VPAIIAGIGAALPDRVVTNADLEARLDTSDEWIRTRTGIVERHHVPPGQATSDLAVAAAEAALSNGRMTPGDVGTLIVATTTPDNPVPATAPRVAAGLGLTCAAFDINAACSGFVYGLRLATTLALSGDPVLLVAADTMTSVVDPTDRTTAVLFGDGAGAVVVTADSRGQFGPFDLGSAGVLADLLVVPAGGSRNPATTSTVAAGDHGLKMQGREVYRNAVAHMVESCEAVLTDAGLDVDDVDLFVGHQANVRILDAVATRLGIPGNRTHATIDRHGNTSSASIPLALADAVEHGRLAPGATLLLSAFGAGLTWGSCLLTWVQGPDDE
jgi:3-oxoacyl-[acyl-carrier-protein] synthase-3